MPQRNKVLLVISFLERTWILLDPCKIWSLGHSRKNQVSHLLALLICINLITNKLACHHRLFAPKFFSFVIHTGLCVLQNFGEAITLVSYCSSLHFLLEMILKGEFDTWFGYNMFHWLLCDETKKKYFALKFHCSRCDNTTLILTCH